MDNLRSTESITGGIDLRELRAFVAVQEHGTFRSAAHELGYTQSALSHQVSALERSLGRRLFTRPGGRGRVQLTAAGEAVYRRARKVLGEAEAIAADVEEAERTEGVRIRVGVSQTTAAELMPGALRVFREDHPGTEVVLSEMDSNEAVLSGLNRGRLDLGFAHNFEPDERVEAIPIMDDPWVILTRRDSAIAGIERPSFDVLDGAEVVAWTRRWRVQIELEEAWAKRGIAPRIVYRTDDNLAMQRLVAAGLGHACVGYLSARRSVDSSLTWLEPRERLSSREIVLCLPRRRETTATVSALVAAIRSQRTR